MAQKYAAIPTTYRGVRFRSRLEARWAAYFDLLEAEWDYEPFDLKGYIPDFAVRYVPSDVDATQYLIEVKPASGPSEMFDACRKIDRSGWLGPATVVGANPSIEVSRHAAWADNIDGDRLIFAGEDVWSVVDDFAAPQMDWKALWKEAGNLTQYKGSRARTK